MFDLFPLTSMHRRPAAALVAASVTALALTACGEQSAPPPEAGEAPATQLGVVAFPTSCSDEVQPTLERGLALIHHMMYDQAETEFQEAARTDEDCAMAHWGIAMSKFQPFWGSADIEAGREAAQRAVALEPPTDRERAYARAALAFFEEEGVSYAARVRSWEAAMTELHEAFPEDQEAAALYGLAHLSVAPGDPDRQDRVARLLEELHGDEPLHPGAIHYAIHAHDVERRAEDGVDFAAAYEDVAPSVPHALHMPSHIYVRLGDWDEVIHWNRESANAALQHPAGAYVSLHYPHALDYLMYGYLQKAEDDAARAVLEEVRSEERYQPHLASAYALAAIPARWHVERRDWEGAAGLEAGVPSDFPWDDFPGAAAMTHFARGLGAARIGDVPAARAEVERLTELEAMADRAEDYHWARQIEVQRRGVSAWIALAEDRADAALEEMTAAAELSAGMEKHPVSPGDLQPARELLGDMLMELGRPDDALRAYEASLTTWPNRYQTLLGAARAAAAAGMEAEARAHYEALTELVTDADPDRDGVLEARERAGSPAGTT